MITTVLISCFGLECLDFEESSNNQLPVVFRHKDHHTTFSSLWSK